MSNMSLLLLFQLFSSILAGSFLQNGRPFDDPIPVYPYPRIVLLGPTGVGKSSLANVLAGCLPTNNSCFKTCSGGASCTSRTSVNVVTYLGDDEYGSLTIADTPGFGDSNGEGDGAIITDMIDTLKHVLGDANVILLCQEYGRFNAGIQKMVLELEALFGRNRIWDHVVLEITKWSYSESAMMTRNISGVTEQMALDDINENLRSLTHLNQTLPGVFIDSYAPMFVNDVTQQEYYRKYTQELWDLATQAPTLDFITIEDILDDLHTCQQTNDCLGQILEGRLSGVEAKVEENTNNIIESSELISANAIDISSNTGDISANTMDISEDKKAIQSNTDNMVVHWSKILENDEDISSNQVIIIESSGLISANALHISSNTGAITDDKKAIQSNTQNIATNSDHISTNTESIKTNAGAISTNDGFIRTNTGDISTNAVSISTNTGLISTNAASISTNTGDISTNTESIKTNDGAIRTNTRDISTNTGAISTNKKSTEFNSQAIAALENSAFVGVCAYQSYTTSTGTLTYDSIFSSFITDSSHLSTSTGTFTASTSGLYMVTWSAVTWGHAAIFLYQQGVQMHDTIYVSSQSDAYDQGSRTVMVELCPGNEIHLGATDNTVYIQRLQFCVTLAKEMPPCP